MSENVPLNRAKHFDGSRGLFPVMLRKARMKIQPVNIWFVDVFFNQQAVLLTRQRQEAPPGQES